VENFTGYTSCHVHLIADTLYLFFRFNITVLQKVGLNIRSLSCVNLLFTEVTHFHGNLLI